MIRRWPVGEFHAEMKPDNARACACCRWRTLSEHGRLPAVRASRRFGGGHARRVYLVLERAFVSSAAVLIGGGVERLLPRPVANLSAPGEAFGHAKGLSMALALFTVSWYSASGVESLTTAAAGLDVGFAVFDQRRADGDAAIELPLKEK